MKSHDFIAYEDLKIAHLVKNHQLAKSHQRCQLGAVPLLAALLWSVHGIPIVAVSARFTTQECWGCGSGSRRA